MRKFYILILLTACTGFFANAQLVSEEKGIDNSEFVIASKADAISGSLDPTDPTYNRISGGSYSGSCGISANLSSWGTDVYYDVYEIHTTINEAAIISITSGGLSDSYMTLYCSFDPNFPDQDIYCGDDDGGVGYMSAFTPADSYIIAANTTYFLVITSFDNGDTGAYSVDMGGNLVFGAFVPLTVPISNWAFAIIGLLAVTLVVFKFRK